MEKVPRVGLSAQRRALGPRGVERADLTLGLGNLLEAETARIAATDDDD